MCYYYYNIYYYITALYIKILFCFVYLHATTTTTTTTCFCAINVQENDKKRTDTFISITYLLIIMKTINVTFDDEEYADLIKRKGELSWHDFIFGCGGKHHAKGV